jgi:hypothetical protein
MLHETKVHSVLKEQQQFRENLQYTAASSNLQCLTPDSIEKCPCSEASSSSATLEIPCILWKPKFPYPAHKL